MDSDFLRINKRTLKWFQSYWSYSFVLVVLNFLTIDFICLPLILVKFELYVCSNLLLLHGSFTSLSYTLLGSKSVSSTYMKQPVTFGICYFSAETYTSMKKHNT